MKTLTVQDLQNHFKTRDFASHTPKKPIFSEVFGKVVDSPTVETKDAGHFFDSSLLEKDSYSDGEQRDVIIQGLGNQEIVYTSKYREEHTDECGLWDVVFRSDEGYGFVSGTCQDIWGNGEHFEAMNPAQWAAEKLSSVDMVPTLKDLVLVCEESHYWERLLPLALELHKQEEAEKNMPHDLIISVQRELEDVLLFS